MTLVNPEVKSEQSNAVSEQKFNKLVELINEYLNNQRSKIPVEPAGSIREQQYINQIYPILELQREIKKLAEQPKPPVAPAKPIEKIDGYVIDNNYVKIYIDKYNQIKAEHTWLFVSIAILVIALFCMGMYADHNRNQTKDIIHNNNLKISEMQAYLYTIQRTLDAPLTIEHLASNIYKATNYTKYVNTKLTEIQKEFQDMMGDTFDAKIKQDRLTDRYIKTASELLIKN